MKEEWRAVPGTNGMYEVSNTGKIRSNNYLGHGKQKELCLAPDTKGYLRIRIVRGKYRATHKMHRLVAEAFISNPDNKPQVNHIDGDKQNNRVDNLEWVTNIENFHHRMRTGLNTTFEAARDAAAERRKKPVILTHRETGERRHYDCIRSAQLDLCISNLSEVLQGKRTHSCGWEALFTDKEVV